MKVFDRRALMGSRNGPLPRVPKVLRGDDGEAFVLCEVGEVFDVQGGEGKVMDKTAGGDPGVVCWSWSAAAFRESGNFTPDAGYLVRAVEHTNSVEPVSELCAAGVPPVPPVDPLGEFSVSDERDDGFVAGEAGEQARGQAAGEA